MFGHLDLGFGQDRIFKTYQCSLCHALADEYGTMARFLTNYDMALCLLVATRGVGQFIASSKKICPIFSINEILNPQYPLLRYLAAITVLLVSEKVKDDMYDEHRRYPSVVSKWLKKRLKKAEHILKVLNFDSAILSSEFEKQRQLEKEQHIDLFQLAGPTSRVMSAIYSFSTTITHTPDYNEPLGRIGYSLGQIIYSLDSLVDYDNDMKTDTFNPLQRCFNVKANVQGLTIPETAKEEACKLLNSARMDLLEAFGSLPENPYVKDIFTSRLARKIEDTVRLSGTTEQTGPLSLFEKVSKIAPVSFISSPAIALASNGKGNPSACYESLTFLVIMLIAYTFICKGCRGRGCSSRPDRVTVDHGCGGQRTYRRDHCSGRYRDDGCC